MGEYGKIHSRLAVVAAAVFIVVSIAIFPASVGAESAQGIFTARQSCQAYQSFRKETNPGNVTLSPGHAYQVFEINNQNSPTWLHVMVDGAKPDKRWVSIDCGDASLEDNVNGNSANQGGAANSCNKPDEADGYVLAVSWQPAFCKTHNDKPECKETDKDSFQAKNFTLHGLWPTKSSCTSKTKYGLCGKYSREEKSHCGYDPAPISLDTYNTLGKVMPSAAHGSCLERHEWYKHGTCQTTWKADDYFHVAMRLLNEWNNGGMAEFMQNNLTKTVSVENLFDTVDTAFGDGARRRLQINCNEYSDLVEVKIVLPAVLPKDQSLCSLISQAPPNKGKTDKRCNERFRVVSY